MEFNLVGEVKAHPRHAQAVAFSPDGNEIITTGMDALAQVWSVPGLDLLRTLEGHEKSVNAASITPDGSRVITGSTDRTAIVWDWESCEALVSLPGHRNTVAGASFSPTGEVAVTASYDGRIGWWSEGSDSLDVMVSHPRNVTCVSFSPDGKVLASSGLGNIVKLWDVETRSVVDEIEVPGQAATGCLYLSDGDLVCSTYEGQLLRFGPDMPEPRVAGQMPAGGPNSVCQVPGRDLLMSSVAGGVLLIDAGTLQPVAQYDTRIKGMYGVGSSPDGSLVAAVGADGKCRLWQIVD